MGKLDDDFEAALERLRQWHADSTKAQSFDGPSISHTKPGAVELRLQSYPHEAYWLNRWSLTRSDADRQDVIVEVRQEFEDLGTSPSKKHQHVVNTLEWKQAIADEEGPSARVARLWCVSASTVRKYRKLYGTR